MVLVPKVGTGVADMNNWRAGRVALLLESSGATKNLYSFLASGIVAMRFDVLAQPVSKMPLSVDIIQYVCYP